MTCRRIDGEVYWKNQRKICTKEDVLLQDKRDNLVQTLLNVRNYLQNMIKVDQLEQPFNLAKWDGYLGDSIEGKSSGLLTFTSMPHSVCMEKGLQNSQVVLLKLKKQQKDQSKVPSSSIHELFQTVYKIIIQQNQPSSGKLFMK